MLVSMEIVDFCCFIHAKLELEKQGLVWVSGENRDTESATSNGSGKSTLFKALSWGLFGQTIDGERGDKVIRHGQREARVTLVLKDGWEVLRVRRKGSTRLTVSRVGTPLDGDKKVQQEKIIDLLGLDFHAFKNTALFGQNDTSRFASPHTRDAERKDMLHRLLRTGILKDCHKIALARVRETKETLARLEGAETAQQRAIDEAVERHDEAVSQMKRWKKDNELKVHVELAHAKALKVQARRAMSEAPDVDALREKEHELRMAIAKAERDREAAGEQRALANELRIKASSHGAKVTVATSVIVDVERQLDELDGESCPVCDSPLDGEHAARHIASLKERHAKASEEWEKRRKKQKALASRADKVEGASKVLEKATINLPLYRAQLTEVSEGLHEAATVTERAKEMVKRARMHLQRSKELEATANPHTMHFVSATEDIRKGESALSAIRSELYEWRKSQMYQEFWARGFSGQGLPSFILDAVVPMISDRANKYLGVLSDGDITVDVSTQRELKASKGEYRDELEIQWVIEGVPGYPPSGGQQRKIEIAIDLALMDLAESREGAGLDIFIADEILDGLDDEGTARVVQLLQALRKRRGTIFVISHQPAMGEAFERTAHVVKQLGTSYVEFAR